MPAPTWADVQNQLPALAAITPGMAEAEKALVPDSSLDVTDLRRVDTTGRVSTPELRGVSGLTISPNGGLLVSGLPSSDPLVADALWNDGGTLKISAGA